MQIPDDGLKCYLSAGTHVKLSQRFILREGSYQWHFKEPVKRSEFERWGFEISLGHFLYYYIRVILMILGKSDWTWSDLGESNSLSLLSNHRSLAILQVLHSWAIVRNKFHHICQRVWSQWAFISMTTLLLILKIINNNY